MDKFEWTVSELQSTIRVMDMLLGKYASDDPTCLKSFNTTQEMAKYFKQFTELMLPKEMRYEVDK